MRFGDNMREVAVTEGDKVEVQMKLGWQVNTWAVGDLVREMSAVTESEIDALMADYQAAYDMMSDVDYRCTITLRYAALRVHVEESKFHPLEERPLVVRERQNER